MKFVTRLTYSLKIISNFIFLKKQYKEKYCSNLNFLMTTLNKIPRTELLYGLQRLYINCTYHKSTSKGATSSDKGTKKKSSGDTTCTCTCTSIIGTKAIANSDITRLLCNQQRLCQFLVFHMLLFYQRQRKRGTERQREINQDTLHSIKMVVFKV